MSLHCLPAQCPAHLGKRSVNKGGGAGRKVFPDPSLPTIPLGLSLLLSAALPALDQNYSKATFTFSERVVSTLDTAQNRVKSLPDASDTSVSSPLHPPHPLSSCHRDVPKDAIAADRSYLLHLLNEI